MEYLVWRHDDEGPEDGRKIRADYAQDAAEAWAEEEDQDDYSYAIATEECSPVVVVRSPDGTELRYRVCGWIRHVYRATAIDDKATGPFPSLQCEGECGFQRAGLGWQCAEGTACGRYVHPKEPGFDELEAWHAKSARA